VRLVLRVDWVGAFLWCGCGSANPLNRRTPASESIRDSAQEYFADGMADELITKLSRISSLMVISHTSVMEYKGIRKHLPQIARELNVDGILEGSVNRENEEIRVTVQLLDFPDDRHIWSESYERPLHGILNLQREVA
jgi:TolB-like protein